MRVPPAEVRRRSLGLRGWLIGAAVVIIVLLLSMRGLAQVYTDYLWFKDAGFAKTWRGLLWAKAVPALIFSAAFFVMMLVNLVIADRVAPKFRAGGPEDEIIERYRHYVAPYAGRVRVIVSLFFAVVMGSSVSPEWRNWILFSNSVSFGIDDPQFDRDIGFYVFRLPFLQFAAGWLFAALLVILIVSAVFHYLNGGIRLQSPFQRVTPQVKVHLSVILALMALTKTVQYYLARFGLTLSARGIVDGATYTDVNAQLPAYTLLMFISVAAAVLFILNIWRRGWVFPIIAVGLWGFISIVVGTIYPAVIQRFVVQPNEFSREEQYIERNIEATRAAFGIDDDNVTIRDFEYSETLDAADVEAEGETLENVRLWDPLPIKEAFSISQEFQTYYVFGDVDMDRYTIGDEQQKPALSSVRELDPANLPDRTWTNQHLVYTHGYGVVSAAADAVDGDSPSYMLRDIPPEGDIELRQPGVYFGENLSGYAVVDTKVAEQEATQEGTRQTRYTGEAGVEVSNLLRKAAFASRFGDWNLLWSGQVTSDSKVLYVRNIRDRVTTAAPFLKFDADPYPVVLDGRLIWMIDAYTTTTRYPYSQSLHPSSLPPGSDLDTDFNYIRNSVKATVDAYDGTIRFYVIDPDDPIVRAYRKAFPELFSDASDMPDGLRDHWRYPEDLFRAQTEQYTQYHMTDPGEFFRKQDLWDIAPRPEQIAPGVTASSTTAPGNDGGRNTTLPSSGRPMDPLYLTMQLPGDEGSGGQEFVLQRSFVPRRKANLASFIVARNDPENYGELVLYQTSASDALSPAQAASSIESDQLISSQFSLLDQRGSSVIRGDVQLIPIGNSILYLRPVWVKGEGAQTFPHYRFVAAALGDRAVLALNVDDAVESLLTGTPPRLGGSAPPDEPTTPTTGPTTTTTTTVPPPGGEETVSELLARADSEFAAADEAARRGDYVARETHLQNARELVRRANELAGQDGGTSPPGATTSTTGAVNT